MSARDVVYAVLGRLSLVFDTVRPALMRLRRRKASGSDANFDKTGIVASGTAALTVIEKDGIRYALYESAAHSYWRAQELTLIHRSRPLHQSPVLDFGCGDGCFMQAALGNADIGVDNDPEALDAARQRGVYRHLVQSSADHIDLPDGSVGTIISNSVLEHLTDLDGQLREFSRLLKPGGRLLFTVPTAVFTEHLTKYFGAAEASRVNGESVHLNLLSIDEWCRRCVAVGLTVEHVTPYQPPRFTYFYRMLRLLGPSGLGMAIEQINVRYTERFWRRIASSVGTSISNTSVADAANVLVVAVHA